MHQQLHRSCFPDAIQDGYMVLSTWSQKSGMNAQIVQRIVEEKASKLVGIGVIQNPTRVTDPLDNLAKAQGLPVYRVLGFSSTGLRLRGFAHGHVHVLQAWVTLLMTQFSHILSLRRQMCPKEKHFGKRVRCIWLVTAGLQGFHRLFTSTLASGPGLQTPCLGRTLFTSAKGLPSARVWEKSYSERYAGLLRLTETGKSLSMVPREEISEFARWY
ncbi:hypothetical protein BDU57DRAFT_524263 [Ampelomyces quisqualis]|uniref:Uncharacterized protein n=1 Tax=Ampelomyces quisqualis TaxID=50730 RepID=A0A6A5QA20_AMPQU|nr:hypothetical protein BDU57DRAFT_524263 [Ampelomyces quisqualis]